MTQSVTVTLVFPDAAAAAVALAALAAPTLVTAPAVIAHEDRPDVGAPLPPVPPAPAPTPEPAPFNPFAAAAGGAAAPVVPPAPVAGGSTPTSDLDKAGLPWDPRIHASTKTKKQDGTWTSKRNLDDAVRTQVEAELRAAVAAPSAPAGTAALAAQPTAPLVSLPQVPAAPSTGVPALPATTAPSPAASVAPTLPPPLPTLPATPQPPAAPPNAPPASEGFGEFMARISPIFSTDPLGGTQRMAAALKSVGLDAVGQLAVRPDLIPAVSAALGPV